MQVPDPPQDNKVYILYSHKGKVEWIHAHLTGVRKGMYPPASKKWSEIIIEDKT